VVISTVVAVALGVAPVDSNGVAQPLTGDYSDRIGAFSQSVDRRGATHVRGRDARGVPYELVMDRNGYVDASVGEWVVSFRVKEPG